MSTNSNYIDILNLFNTLMQSVDLNQTRERLDREYLNRERLERERLERERLERERLDRERLDRERLENNENQNNKNQNNENQNNEDLYFIEYTLRDGRRVSDRKYIVEENGVREHRRERMIGNHGLLEVTTFSNNNRHVERFTRGFNPTNDNVNQFIEDFNGCNNYYNNTLNGWERLV